MTERRHTTVMAVRQMRYARRMTVMMSAGISTIQNRMGTV